MNRSKKIDHIYFFDLDHTLLRCNCSFRFGGFLFLRKKISFWVMLSLVWSYCLHKVGLIGVNQMHQNAFKKFFLKKEAGEIEALSDLFVSEYFQKMVNPDLVPLLNQIQTSGGYTVLFSSSPDFLVKRFAQKMQLSDWKATSYTVDSSGLFSEVSFVFEGEQKASSVEEFVKEFFLKIENTTAYSDSHLDLQFLQKVGIPIAVNPTAKLRSYAKKKCWKVIG